VPLKRSLFAELQRCDVLRAGVGRDFLAIRWR
jgi:hypothetical protein